MDRCAELLVVDDNLFDARLLEEVFSESDAKVCLSYARDGLEALRFLRREDGHSHAPRPDLIVLDLKMPGMDGLTFLEEMKADESLRAIEVVILTGSDAPEDKEAALSLGARCYFTKPGKLDGWRTLTERLEEVISSDDG